MTAEVAILNKGAVALAADSAVTISGSGPLKIYNSVNKIFELHDESPVGILIYGSMDFMGIHLETIIKQYRRDRSRKTSFAHVKEFSIDFRNYLESEVRYTADHELLNVGEILYAHYSELRERVAIEARQQVRTVGKLGKRDINRIYTECVDKYLAEVEETDKSECFRRVAEKSVFSKYATLHDRVIAESFPSQGCSTLST